MKSDKRQVKQVIIVNKSKQMNVGKDKNLYRHWSFLD